jgi:5-methylcytosine-specific restriction endonuclease McrA
MKWAPISLCQKQARVKRGLYKCAGCGAEVPASVKDENGRRKKNIHVDHINPIVDPAVGWTTWDDCIERMFCELDNLQVLCGDCHEVKSNTEKQIAKERRAQEKENNGE